MNHFLRLYFDSLTGQCLESLIKSEFYLRIANKRSYSFCSFDRSLLTPLQDKRNLEGKRRNNIIRLIIQMKIKVGK